MRIAFFGGTFDPPHRGHMAIAKAAIERLGLDEVWMAPAGVQPLKRGVPHTPFTDRLAMVQLACEGEGKIVAAAIDAPRTDGSPNYTYDTLLRIREGLRPADRLFLLIGADSVETLPKWHRVRELFGVCTVVIAGRPGTALEVVCGALPEGIGCTEEPGGTEKLRAYQLHGDVAPGACVYVLPDLQYEVSATAIREALRSGPEGSTAGGRAGAGELTELVSPRVVAYAREHGLYR